MIFNCIAPQEINEDELLAYLDDPASLPKVIRQQLEAHLTQCAACTEHLAALRQTEQLFQVTLFRQSCPDLDSLLQYQAGFLSAAAYQSIQHHLATCIYCPQELAQLARVEQTTSARQPVTPSLKQWLEAGRRLITATLLPTTPTPFALRGQSQSQQTYLAPPYQITLAKIPPLVQGDYWEIQGQVIHEESPFTPFQGTVELWQGEQLIKTENVDEFGFFVFPDVHLGQYSLHIALKAEILTIDDFILA